MTSRCSYVRQEHSVADIVGTVDRLSVVGQLVEKEPNGMSYRDARRNDPYKWKEQRH